MESVRRINNELSIWEKHAQRYIYDIWLPKVILIEDLPKYSTIVELGCGDGTYVPLLVKKCNYLVAADISLLRLKRAKKRIVNMGLGRLVDFILCDARYPPLRTSSVDLVYASEVFEHLSNIDFEVVLTEVERFSQDLLATLPNPHAPHFKTDSTHILRYTVTGLIKNLRSRGTGFRYQIWGMCLPIVRERSLRNQVLRRLTKRILKVLPWLSTTLVIAGARK